ncbi:ABC transporter permease [Frischella perrara]|uniref:ABC transporter permease n=1 Tax=Frischella perrara TaxID=1267021 RepID=A0A0A7S5U9_FRIPE|nr:FtsX-like permease family protein [Frischella perrara]AJA44651.1 ABC-type transport system, involved in lipoprotein release, permease component [Frischella perrara]MCT6874805.1 FtsX-like permease family protein [Frischella perrara]PWV65027.1 putative ABC transport system permease protein [Frischella perrara]PXY96062.1 ABC transporter permease [Frischella perrara]
MINKNKLFLIKALISSLVRRRSRILVALLATAIGATVLLGMITLCFDIPRQMGKEFRSYGANLIFTPAGNNTTINFEQVKLAIQNIPKEQLIGVTPFRYLAIRSNVVPYTLVGTDFQQIAHTSPFWQIEGQFPSKDDEIMIGIDIANYAHLSIGDTMPIAGKTKQNDHFEQNFKISGIVKTGKTEDNFIFVNLTKLEELLEEQDEVEVVELSISAPEVELQNYITIIKQDFPLIEPHLIKWVTQSETQVLGKLASLLFLVTSVVLILTMICVATTMMTVVIERRKEIGLKKALGAENSDIAQEFLAESVILGFIGGLIGSVCGLLFAQIISREVFGRSIACEYYLIPVTIIITIVVTVVACLIPVKRAVNVEPGLVLRGE